MSISLNKKQEKNQINTFLCIISTHFMLEKKNRDQKKKPTNKCYCLSDKHATITIMCEPLMTTGKVTESFKCLALYTNFTNLVSN